jgi:hypothetical protein
VTGLPIRNFKFLTEGSAGRMRNYRPCGKDDRVEIWGEQNTGLETAGVWTFPIWAQGGLKSIAQVYPGLAKINVQP